MVLAPDPEKNQGKLTENRRLPSTVSLWLSGTGSSVLCVRDWFLLRTRLAFGLLRNGVGPYALQRGNDVIAVGDPTLIKRDPARRIEHRIVAEHRFRFGFRLDQDLKHASPLPVVDLAKQLRD